MERSQAGGAGPARRAGPEGEVRGALAAGFAVGLGLTNDCNLACAHCYRDTDRIDRLSLDDVRRVCDSLPVRAVNLGTGENALHPEFRRILAYLHTRGIVVTLTSNGYSASVLPDDELCWLRDVEFSLDFASEREQDAWRGAGNWRLVLAQIDRCRAAGLGVTVTAVMMRTNYDRLPALAALAAARGATLRVNVYQTVKTDAFALSYEQFWTGFRLLLEAVPVAACTEPLVRAVLGLSPDAGGCGRSTVRVTPRGEVLPCVYWPKRSLTIADVERLGPGITACQTFCELHPLPDFCRGCRFADACRGGCPARRLARGGLHLPDEFCPLARGMEVPPLALRPGSTREFPKAGSACTTVFGGETA
jgi:radical SAM protein with 4Fe4S-binding SPASM domain